MKKILTILLILMMVTSVVFAQGRQETSKTATENYSFGGSSTVAPIANSAIPAFEVENPNVKVSYETLGSSTGISQLLEGTLSLAGSSRVLKDSEVKDGCVTTTIALDGITVGVNETVSIANLSMQQLKGIFTGEITNWNEVGGLDQKIEVILRDEASGTRASFEEIVHNKIAPKQNAIVAHENGDVASKIAATPGSIGYIGMAFGSIITEAGGSLLTINNVKANVENVLNNTYPISRALYVVTIGQPKEGTTEKAFIDFLLSEEGQEIVAENQFIRLN
ncbi:MAG: phosphate ABC transporter substrate-binding protein [Sphaerochaetaceae bacterium]|nr:phosphate ABC transporter substrate-binding protein [Sphaerochaetaceae bacterium]